MKSVAKLLIALCLFGFSLNTAIAEDFEDIVRKSDSLFNEEQLDSVISYSQWVVGHISEFDNYSDSLLARLYLNVAMSYKFSFRYKQADSVFFVTLDFCRSKFGENSFLVGVCYFKIARMYHESGYYDKAINYLNLSTAIFDRIFGLDNIHSAQNYHAIAQIEMTAGRLMKAEPLYKKALEIISSVLGEDNISTAICLRNLGALYLKKAMYTEAEECYRHSLEIKTRLFGENSHLLGSLYIDIAQMYTNMYRYGDADSLLVKAVGMYETAPGDYWDLYLAKALSLLGRIDFKRNRLDEAEPVLIQTLKLREDNLGPDHPDVAYSLSELSNLYCARGEYEKAEPLILRSARIEVDRRGPFHINTVYAYKRLCDFYMKKGDLTLAERAIDSSMICLSNIFTEDNYLVIECYEARRDLYLRQGKIENAIADAKKAIDLRSDALFNGVITMAESDAMECAVYLKSALGKFLSIYFDHFSSIDKLSHEAIDLILFNKGLISDGVFERRLAALMRDDPATLALLDSLQELKFEQSRLLMSSLSSDDYETSTRKAEIAASIDEVEKTLIKTCANVKKWHNFRKFDREKLISMIPENTVYIDYFKYEYIDTIDEESGSRYLALVLSHDSEPALINLGDASVIDSLTGAYRMHMLVTAGHGGTIHSEDMAGYKKIASSLYETIWKPISGNIPEGSEMLLIVPDGDLHRISFAGLIDPDYGYFIEKYTIQYLSSGRDLLRIKENGKQGYGLFAMGDPDYNDNSGDCSLKPPLSDRLYPDQPINGSVSRVSYDEFSDIRLTRLPGTRNEIEMIAENWKTTTGEPTDIFTGNRASEECFRSRASGNRVLHLATHGYFLDGFPKTSAHSYNDREINPAEHNPLLLSGLFLAGANNNINDYSEGEYDDGILTANEVTSMNLSGVDLVVLSSCESGLGKLQSGEGVFGLRRAFQMAGAKTVISTLWPVTDQSATAVFSRLYGSFDTGIASSLRDTQLDIIAGLRNRGRYDHPYNWASSVVFGDWR